MILIKNSRIFFLFVFCLFQFSLLAQDGRTCGAVFTATVNVCNINKPIIGSNSGGTNNPFEVPTTSGSSCIPSFVNAKDYWFKFVATNTTSTISVTSSGAAVNKNIAFVVFAAGAVCSSNLLSPTAETVCVNNDLTTAAQTESVALTTAIGQTYFVRIVQFNAPNNVTVAFCVTSLPINDEPAGAIALPAVTSACSYTVGNIKSATPSTCVPSTPSCGSYLGTATDVWYSVLVPASGNLFLQTAVATGSIGIASYTGSPCASLTQLGCSEGNPEGSSTAAPSLYVPGLAVNTPVYIRVWNKNGTTPGTFSLCATTLGPCGNSGNLNDFCSNPYAVYTTGATSTMVAVGYTGTPIYTNDQPGNLIANTCATPIINSWYTFIASSSSVSIPIQTSSCEVDIELFTVSTNTYGCCKTFTPVSGFDISNGAGICAAYTWSVQASSSTTITASSLTPGQPYYMMVNYPSGVCNFSVTNWAYTGVLPVDMLSFTGSNEGKYNQLEWITASEKNIEAYTLERSQDGINFEDVRTVNAIGGTLQSKHKYTVRDDNPFLDVTYYRVSIRESDGAIKYTNIISVNLQNMYDNIYNLHPNPTSSDINFEYYSKSIGTISLELLGFAGNMIYKTDERIEEGKNKITVPMANLKNGIYILGIISEKTGKTTHHKIIKN